MSPVLTALAKSFRVERLEGRGLLLAVSGGADSLALLFGTAQLREAFRLTLHVATVAHGLRPEARQEAEQVASHAAALGLPFHLVEAPVSPGPGVEARAREARYAALEQARAGWGLACVVTAHTASDQAETLLMHLVRGSALRGARGVWRRRGTLVRPLLEVSREQVLAFLAERSLVPAEDVMNRDPRFLRVRIRREVLPVLETAAGFPVVAPLARFAAQAAEDEAFLSEQAAAAHARLTVEGAPDVLDAVGLRALPRPLRRRVLVRLLEAAGVEVSGAVVALSLEAVESGGRAGLGRRHTLRCDGGTVRLQVSAHAAPLAGPGGMAPSGWPLPPSVDGEWLAVPWAGLRFRLSRSPPGEGVALPLPEGAGQTLEVRRRRPGDRLGGGGRKLQDVLVDARVPCEARDDVPLVVDGEGRIVWVVGLWPRTGASASVNGREVKPALWLVADSLEGATWPTWLGRRLGRQRAGARKAGPL